MLFSLTTAKTSVQKVIMAVTMSWKSSFWGHSIITPYLGAEPKPLVKIHNSHFILYLNFKIKSNEYLTWHQILLAAFLLCSCRNWKTWTWLNQHLQLELIGGPLMEAVFDCAMHPWSFPWLAPDLLVPSFQSENNSFKPLLT